MTLNYKLAIVMWFAKKFKENGYYKYDYGIDGKS